MNNNKNVVAILLLSSLMFYNIAQAMELSSEFYHEKSEMSFLMQVIEKKEHDASEEELKIIEQKNSNVKSVKNYSCSRENCIFVASHQNRIYKHREMHRLQDALPHITMYRCDTCDYLANKQRDINDHKKTHDDTKRYYCEVCDAWFKSVNSKSRHERESLTHKQNSKARPLLVLTNG